MAVGTTNLVWLVDRAFFGNLQQMLQGQSLLPIEIDLTNDLDRQVVVDREVRQYLGHPTRCLLDDDKTILIGYPKGHGRGEIVYRRRNDGGRTWSER